MFVANTGVLLRSRFWRLNIDKAVKLSWEKIIIWLVYTYRKKRYMSKYIFFYLKMTGIRNSSGDRKSVV